MDDAFLQSVRKGEWLELTLPMEPAAEPQVWLAEELGLPPKLLRQWAATGGIEQRGRRLRLRMFPEESSDFAPEWKSLDILYEDDFCLVVNKPAGMPVHPSGEGQTGTLANALTLYYASTGQSCRIRHIHRLDKDTSGPVLYAKNELAQLRLDEDMRLKKIRRGYLAWVRGQLSESGGTLNFPIGKDRHHNKRRRVSPSGQPAVTHYEVVERFRNATRLRLYLETGRTHQIRVHLSHIGHPLLGDRLYGGPGDRIGRQALHGETLEFIHPWTGEEIRTVCPWPEDLKELDNRLGEE
jgi:23S rRNA pseudouridine1911/1915/1917 synthase